MLKGKRIYLRELTVADVGDQYVQWLADPEVNQYLETRFSEQTPEMIADFVQSKEQSENEFLYGMFLTDSDTHIGNIKIGPVNPYHSYAQVSLFIGDKAAWGKGFATEAIDLIVDHGFNTMKLDKLEAGCYEENIGSKRAFEKCGFLVEGMLKDHCSTPSGRTSVILLGLTKA